MLMLSTTNLLIREYKIDDMNDILVIYNKKINMKYIPHSVQEWSLEALEKKFSHYSKPIAS